MKIQVVRPEHGFLISCILGIVEKTTIHTKLQTAFGETLRKRREAKGLTLLDLEIMTGISNSNLSKVERGKRTVELITIVKIINALELDPNDLITNDVLKTVPST